MTTKRGFLIVIGTAKAGTSALASWLGAREDIVLGRIKEPKFLSDLAEREWIGPGAKGFRTTTITDEASWLDNFAHKPDAVWAVDASTDYLWCPNSPDRIAALAERHMVRLICLTRDPVDRAISQYRHTLRMGMDESLGTALDAETDRIAAGWHPLFWHVRRSLIATDITGYADRFGDSLMIVDYGELAQPDLLLTRLARFLGLPERPLQARERRNQSVLPRNRLLQLVWQNPTVKAAARSLVPKDLRHQVYTATHSARGMPRKIKPAERALLSDALTEEITACVRSPLIDTSSWHSVDGTTGNTMKLDAKK